MIMNKLNKKIDRLYNILKMIKMEEGVLSIVINNRVVHFSKYEWRFDENKDGIYVNVCELFLKGNLCLKLYVEQMEYIFLKDDNAYIYFKGNETDNILVA